MIILYIICKKIPSMFHQETIIISSKIYHRVQRVKLTLQEGKRRIESIYELVWRGLAVTWSVCEFFQSRQGKGVSGRPLANFCSVDVVSVNSQHGFHRNTTSDRTLFFGSFLAPWSLRVLTQFASVSSSSARAPDFIYR